ncbi:hypothetical protein V6C27_13295 [Peptococcaceae bacterium 1198_IL3148]
MFLANTFRWFLSVGIKFARVVPGQTLSVVSATLISEVALLLASFLPLKVIMLLASPGVPSYFPQVFLEFDRTQLVLLLSVTAIAFYFVYLLAEKLIGYWADCGAQLLLQKSKKITLFENQVEVAVMAYKRYTRCLAAGIFAGLAFLILGIIYPLLTMLLLGSGVGVYLIFVFLYLVNHSFCVRMYEGLGEVIGMVGQAGFLLTFAFIVMDFLFGSPPDLLVAIISIVLVRQALNKLVVLAKDFIALKKQRLKITALFFYGHTLMDENPKNDSGFWPLLEVSRCKEWIQSVLVEATGVEVKGLRISWHQTGVADVVAFDIQAPNKTEALVKRYLVKLFHTKRQALAIHEATLLMAFESGGLPVPRFYGVQKVDSYNCHIFELYSGTKPSPQEAKYGVRFLLAELWSIEPPKDIVNRFRRSRPLLAERINRKMIDRLLIIAEHSDSVVEMKRLKQKLDVIREILSDLPLCIYNPDLVADTMIVLENNKFMATNWGKWSLEPVGAGWPLSKQEWEILPEFFSYAAKKRPTLDGVAIKKIRLSALMFAFERFYERQQFISAIELIPLILECVEEVGEGIGK